MKCESVQFILSWKKLILILVNIVRYCTLVVELKIISNIIRIMLETKNTRLQSSQPRPRGRLFPEYRIPEAELVRRRTEKEMRVKRYQEIFDRIQPELIEKYYNWYIAIEHESGDYFCDRDEGEAVKKARQKYPKAMLGIMRVNETGTCGKI